MRQNESLPWDMPTSSGTRTALMAGRKPTCRCGSRCRNRSRRSSAFVRTYRNKITRGRNQRKPLQARAAGTSRTCWHPPRCACGNALQNRHRAANRELNGAPFDRSHNAERAAFPHDCDPRHRANQAGIKKVTKISLTISANRSLWRLCIELRTSYANQHHGENLYALVIADNVNSVHQAAVSG